MKTLVFSSRAWLVLAILFSALGCNLSEDTASRSLSEEPSACTLIDATTPVYGPAEFARHTGKPKTDYATFEAPLDGEVCVVVTNGLHDPPHGKRISSAWIRIDGKLATDPDAFSQEVDRVTEPFPVVAGEHELSVKLASKPGSFITVELMFLPADTDPPEISIVPEDGARISTDMPLVRIEYTDDITGVDLESLSILMNGSDVTERFQVAEEEAEWQITIDSYLEEGPNEISVRLSDRIGNEANEKSTFTVQTHTGILKADLTHEDSRYRKRSAYKLLFRPQEISTGVQRRCLKQLYETPEPRAFERFVEILRSSGDHLSRALAAGALGEAAGVDEAIGADPETVEALSTALFSDTSWSVKAASARALGLAGGEEALASLLGYIEEGPEVPKKPRGCDEGDYPPEIGLETFFVDCETFDTVSDGVQSQAIRAAIRIAGQDYPVGNPGSLGQALRECVESLQEHLDGLADNGGMP